jgi:hypothetical protein
VHVGAVHELDLLQVARDLGADGGGLLGADLAHGQEVAGRSRAWAVAVTTGAGGISRVTSFFSRQAVRRREKSATRRRRLAAGRRWGMIGPSARGQDTGA